MKSSLIRIGMASLFVAGVISMMWIAFQDREVSAAGNTYYVATNGSDSNPGTETQPFRTVQHAANIVTPGDTVIIRGGTYGAIGIDRSGSEGNPITFKGYPGETAILDSYIGGNKFSTPWVVDMWGVQWVNFENLKITNSNPNHPQYLAPSDASADGSPACDVGIPGGIRLDRDATLTRPSNYLNFTNMEISYVWTAIFGAIGTRASSDFLNITNVVAHHMRDQGYYLDGTNIRFKGGEVYYAQNIGIRVGYGSRGANHSSGLIIENVRIHDIGSYSWADLSDGRGCRFFGPFEIGISAYLAASSENVIIRNNVIYNVGTGIDAWGIGPGSLIANNTINASGGAINSTDESVARVINNIIAGALNLGSNHTVSNNLTTDPRFVNAAAGDFHLQSGSPAINAGMTLPEVPCDFEGNKRPGGSAYDIGAYEYGSSPATDCPKGTTGGPTPTPTTPPTPTPVPPPAITLTATPSSLSTVGQGTQLFWTVQNAASCNASGGWSGAKDPGGGTERHTPTQSTTYVLTCTGPGGTAQQSVTVTFGAAGNCTRYQSGSTIPQGFGVPWDVSNPSSLLLKAECTPPTVVLKVGDNANTTYVYKTAYVAPSGSQSWGAVDLFGGTLISHAWYVGFAQGITQVQDMSKASYYVAYTCKWIPPAAGQAGRWKCGCRDTACTQSFWQIQRLQQ